MNKAEIHPGKPKCRQGPWNASKWTPAQGPSEQIVVSGDFVVRLKSAELIEKLPCQVGRLVVKARRAERKQTFYAPSTAEEATMC